MPNQEHLDILQPGVESWNQWRKKHPEIRPDLSSADLKGVDLKGVDLKGAYLISADLSNANLSNADLSNADLSGANLSDATLIAAHLSGAKLRERIFDDKHRERTNLSGADLSGADLSDADLSDADLSDADLSTANLNDAKVFHIIYLDRKHAQNTSRRERFLIWLYRSIRTWLYPRSIMRGKYKGIRVASCFGNATFKRDAEDQDFLDTLEHQWKGTWRIGLFRAWGIIDYGRNMLAAFLIAGFLIIVFGSIYSVFPSLISYSASHPKTWFSPYYFSIVTFTTLGFGDVTANGWCGEMVVSLQVILGYLTLGLLISILANKVARRS